ncbi:MAG TPA: hypothetical protein VHB73_02340 [Alphaproteobacteria bacterium]|nr:hypothetical protein [Alphaproteobacteria bacterium]
MEGRRNPHTVYGFTALGIVIGLFALWGIQLQPGGVLSPFLAVITALLIPLGLPAAAFLIIPMLFYKPYGQPQSGWGVASLAISFALISITIAPFVFELGYFLMLAIYLDKIGFPLGLLFGILGLYEKRKKRSYAIMGIVTNALSLAVLVLFLLGFFTRK